MKTTEECPLRAVLFGRMTAQEADETMPLTCSFNCDAEVNCCLFRFLEFLFFHCEEPEAMLERLYQVIKAAPLATLH